MKKIVCILLCALLCACSSSTTEEDSATVTDATVTTTVEPTEVTETVEPEETEEAEDEVAYVPDVEKPYENSQLNEMDFSFFYEDKPAVAMAPEMSVEDLYETYGAVPAVPEELELVDLGSKDDGYHYFSITNSLDGVTINFAIIEYVYDLQLQNTFGEFSVDEDGHMELSFYFYYDEDVVTEEWMYDKVSRENQISQITPSIKHYYITMNETYISHQENLDTQNGYSLLKEYDYYYVDESSEYYEQQMVGINYLDSIDYVIFTE